MWGVDSYNPANHEIRVPRRLRAEGDPERQTLYEFLRRRMGTAPGFWGRYLNTYAYGVTQGEVQFLHGHGCKVLLVYNGPRQPLTGPRCHDAGFEAARQACEIARRVGVPAGVRIYADLEGWVVDPNWLRGWFSGMWQSEYAGMGGLYGRGAEIPQGGQPYHPRRVWATSASAAVDEELDTITDQTATGQRTSKQAIPYVWSNMPRSGGDPPMTRSGQAEGAIPSGFGAVGPASPLIQTQVWQYRLNCPLGTDHPLVDMDMATDAGFADMW